MWNNPYKVNIFTSLRLFPCNFKICRRPQFSMPSMWVKWLKEQSIYIRVGASERPLVLINWLWFTTSRWRFCNDSKPPINTIFKAYENALLKIFKNYSEYTPTSSMQQESMCPCFNITTFYKVFHLFHFCTLLRIRKY